MKTNIVCIHEAFVVKTGRVFVYETGEPVYDEDNVLVDFGDVSFSDEIIDVCTGEHYAFDGVIHEVGTPSDSFVASRDKKRGRHSKSWNKQTIRQLALQRELDELPF